MNNTTTASATNTTITTTEELQLTSTTCSLYPNHPDRCKVILAIHRTSNSLSLIGCVLIIFLIILLKRYKIFVQKMVLAMVISALFSCISYFIGDVNTTDEHACRLQSILTQFFDWAVLLWIFIITVNMLLVVKNLKKSNIRYLAIYHAFVWIVSLLWTIIPLFGNAYGKAGIWCWIKRESTAYRFGTFYGPEIVLLVLLILMYVYISYTVIQATKPDAGTTVEMQNINRRYRSELKPLIWYPICYLLVMIPMLLYRIEDASHPSKPPNYGLIIIATIFGPSIGAINAIVFTVVNASLQEVTWDKVKTEIKQIFKTEEKTRVTHDIKVDDADIPHPSSGYHSSTTGEMTEINLDKYN